MNDLMNLYTSIENAMENSATLTFSAPKTDAERAELFNALSAKSINISEMIGKVIRLSNVVFQGRNFTEEDTGDYRKAMRVIFIDDEGGVYHSYSAGILNSVKTFLSVYGTPDTWEQSIPVTVERVTLKSGGQTFTLRGV